MLDELQQNYRRKYWCSINLRYLHIPERLVKLPKISILPTLYYVNERGIFSVHVSTYQIKPSEIKSQQSTVSSSIRVQSICKIYKFKERQDFNVFEQEILTFIPLVRQTTCDCIIYKLCSEHSSLVEAVLHIILYKVYRKS